MKILPIVTMVLLTQLSVLAMPTPEISRPKKKSNIEISNLKINTTEPFISEYLTAFGIGTFSNPTLHVNINGSNQTINTGLKINVIGQGYENDNRYYLKVIGHMVICIVREQIQGEDLTGDGFKNDIVLHTYNAKTGEIIHNGVPMGYQGPSIKEGQTFDTNNDPDNLKVIFNSETKVMVWDVNSNTVTDTGLNNEEGIFRVDGDYAAFESDNTLKIYNLFTGTTVDTGLTHDWSLLEPGFFELKDNLLLVSVRENTLGQDINGDGDMSDYIPHISDVNGNVTNFPLTIYGFGENQRMYSSGNNIIFYALESTFSQIDLNGDGDFNDKIPYAYNHSTGLLDQIPDISLHGFTALGKQILQQCKIVGDKAILIGREDPNLNQDVNGNSIFLDYFYAIYDFSDKSVNYLPYAVAEEANFTGNLSYDFNLPFNGKIFAFPVNEAAQFGVDLNGDGDILDNVIHVYDIATRQIKNLKVPSSTKTTFVHKSIVCAALDESEQGVDLNGDGVLNSEIWHIYRNNTMKQLTNLSGHGFYDIIGGGIIGGQGGDHPLKLAGQWGVIHANEIYSGFVDLNENGHIDFQANTIGVPHKIKFSKPKPQ